MANLGLKAEAKTLDAIKWLQKIRWRYEGFYIQKAVRTYNHREPEIRVLDSKKIDIVVVFRRRKVNFPTTLKGPLIFVLQVKSTLKSYRRFQHNQRGFRGGRTNRKHNKKRGIKCVLAKTTGSEHDDNIYQIGGELINIFVEVLDITLKKRSLRRDPSRNPFFRQEIPIRLF